MANLFRTASLAVLLFVSALLLHAQQPQGQSAPGSQSTFTFKVNSNIVLTNVVVRDKKTGQPVRGLTAKDFTILENGKPQKIISFDFENVDQAPPLNEATISGKGQTNLFAGNGSKAIQQQLNNRRLIVMFFDLTSMQPEDLLRAQESARNYIEHQMRPADLVAVISLDSALAVNQDFTSDKQLLRRALAGWPERQNSFSRELCPDWAR